MCGYLLTDEGYEHGSCFDPDSNNHQFYTVGCFSDVDVTDNDGHKHHGRFCICDGEQEDLCNGDYFKHDPNGAPSNTPYFLLIAFIIYQLVLQF